MFLIQAGKNLYKNSNLECLTDQDCRGEKVCYEWKCVDKCQSFQVLTNIGTCKTSWLFFMPTQAGQHIFLPWIFIKASYLHGFYFDPLCSPTDKCSLLITSQTIPNRTGLSNMLAKFFPIFFVKMISAEILR